MSDQDYYAQPGLSCSGMADLAVSPMRYWYWHLNPERPVEEPTPYMVFGTALHCAVLEPAQFEERFARDLNPDDYPGLLRTMDDLRAHLRHLGITPKGTRKSEVIAQVQSATPAVPILEVLEAEHNRQHEGKGILSADFWVRIHRAADALRLEPAMARILSDNGQAERPFFVTDPVSGVNLKARMDLVTPSCTLDVKTFTARRGKSIDRAVAEAIYYEGYYRQAWFYSKVRAIHMGNVQQSGPQTAPPFVIAFVESEEPHEVRIRSILPKSGGEVSVLWERARIECTHLIRQYADCMARWGMSPWREEREIDPLLDEELPQLSY